MGKISDIKNMIEGDKGYEPEFIKALKGQKYTVDANDKGDSGVIKLYGGSVKIPFSIAGEKLTFDLPRVNFEDPKSSSKFLSDFLKALDNNSGDLER